MITENVEDDESQTSVILDDREAYSAEIEEEEKEINSEDSISYTNLDSIQIDDSNTFSAFDDANEELDATTAVPATMAQCTLLIGLGGAASHIITMNVLVYLDHVDLCHFSRTSSYFLRICKSPELWTELYRKDFIMESLDALEAGRPTSTIIGTPDARMPLNRTTATTAVTYPYSTAALALSSQSQSPSHFIMSKTQYVEKYEEMRGRIDSSKLENFKYELDKRRQRWLRVIETALDITQMRILMPLCLIAGFLSISLFCQKQDGALDDRISYWDCATPILFFLAYFFLSVLLTKLLHSRHSANRDNPQINNLSSCPNLSGLWVNFESFPKSIMHNEQSQQLTGLPVLLSITILCALQVIFVGVKLSLPLSTSHLSWGLVFLPIWCLFTLYCIFPIRYLAVQNTSLYIAGCILFWIPLFVFFVGLTIKLDRKPGLRLAVLFVPYWLIEGFILLSAAHLLMMSILRIRTNSEAKVEMAVFAVVVVSVLPFVIFQILLCVRDEDLIKHRDVSVTATQAVIPLLVILGWFSGLSVYFSMFHRTAYQLTQVQMDEYSGVKVIINM